MLGGVRTALLSGRAAAVPVFDPASLFSGGKAGVLFMPASDPASMFQDLAGTTTPANAAGNPVGVIRDKSGNGNHVVAPSTTTRPILTQIGSLLVPVGDGVDDVMRATFAMSQPMTRISLIRQISWISAARIFASAGAANSTVLYQSPSTPQLTMYNGAGAPAASPALSAWWVITEIMNGASSKIAVDNGGYTTGNSGTTAPDGISLFGCNTGAGTASSNTAIAAVIQIAGVMADADIAKVWTLFGALAGKPL